MLLELVCRLAWLRQEHVDALSPYALAKQLVNQLPDVLKRRGWACFEVRAPRNNDWGLPLSIIFVASLIGKNVCDS